MSRRLDVESPSTRGCSITKSANAGPQREPVNPPKNSNPRAARLLRVRRPRNTRPPPETFCRVFPSLSLA